MKKSITRYLFVFSYFLLVSQSAIGQNFLWGRSGGSMEPSGGNDDETIKDMAMDRNGNVYILAVVKKNGLQIAKQPLTGYGWRDVMLASFTPKGNLRWVKLIGNGDEDRAHWLGTDGKDGVYLSAVVSKSNNPCNIDKDASSPKNAQTNILVKYDTAGKFQWYRHPEMDTFTGLTLATQSRIIAMDVAPSGTVYWLMKLPPGGYGNGALTVTDTSTYLLKYTASGGFSYHKPNFDFSGSSIGSTAMTIDEPNNQFYLSGYNATSGEVWFNGKQLGKQCAYVGCFKLDGSFIWSKESTGGIGYIYSRVAIDAIGNIYAAGFGQVGLNFNGFIVTNAGSVQTPPMIIKMDKNGNLLWGKAGSSTAASGGSAVAVRSADEVMLMGYFNGGLEWPGFSGKMTSTTYDVFITRFKTSNGDVNGMDMIPSSSGTDYPRRMCADGKGNVYLGGEFTQKLYVNYQDTLANTTGGTTDWFLIKYGNMWPAGVSAANTFAANIYPNPATGQIRIEGISTGTTIRVMNMLGQQVLNVLSNGESENIDISNVAPGSYLVQIAKPDGFRENYKIEKR